MPDRLADLETDLQYLLSAGYQFHSIRDFAASVADSNTLKGKHAVMRIDVDSDPEYCSLLGEALHKLQVPATFYFRLSTLNASVMQQLDSLGFEIGYHFEEIATFAKAEKLFTKDDVLQRIAEPKALFVKNFAFFTTYFGKATHTVASHGDFANRRLGLTNALLIDNTIRCELSIEAEAYDQSLINNFDDNIIDTSPPHFWRPRTPSQCCDENTKENHVIRMVIHPKQWRRNFVWNTKQNIERVIEGLKYK